VCGVIRDIPPHLANPVILSQKSALPPSQNHDQQKAKAAETAALPAFPSNIPPHLANPVILSQKSALHPSQNHDQQKAKAAETAALPAFTIPSRCEGEWLRR
jgi:hypothetical protein